jgi:precorrin-8X/cobalt-precorrin-8 methylmutase
MGEYIQNPATITADSFAIIRDELKARGYQFEPLLSAVIERIIHSTADFDFASITRTSLGAIEAGVQALRVGCAVVTDVQMARVGISAARLAALGGMAYCFVADEITRQRAEASRLTRSAVGMAVAAEQGLLDGSIIAIGNAPTALYEVIHLIGEGIRPALVIGVPVGFVSTVESKEALTQVTTVPWIVTVGRKGGSTVAVAIVNALLRLAVDAPATEVD